MRLLLNPQFGGSYGPTVQPQATPAYQPPPQPQYGTQGYQANYAPQPAYEVAPAVGQGFAMMPGYAPQTPQQPAYGTFGNPIQPTYQVQGIPGQPAAPIYYAPPSPYQAAPAQIPAQFVQQPAQGVQLIQGQQVPAGVQPPFQFSPSNLPQVQLTPQYQPPQPQQQPPGVFATLPAQQPSQAQGQSIQPYNLPVREPQTIQDYQQALGEIRLQQIQALQRAGQTDQAMAQTQSYYQAQIQTLQQQLAQRDQQLGSTTQSMLLTDSLAGVSFRDQASALNCRNLIAARVEIGQDGQLRERGSGRPGQQAIQEYLRSDLAVFLAAPGQGGGPTPQGQYPGQPAPQGPMSPGEAAMQRWESSRRAGLAQGQYLPGWQQVVAQPVAPYAAFAGR